MMLQPPEPSRLNRSIVLLSSDSCRVRPSHSAVLVGGGGEEEEERGGRREEGHDGCVWANPRWCVYLWGTAHCRKSTFLPQRGSHRDNVGGSSHPAQTDRLWGEDTCDWISQHSPVTAVPHWTKVCMHGRNYEDSNITKLENNLCSKVLASYPDATANCGKPGHEATNVLHNQHIQFMQTTLQFYSSASVDTQDYKSPEHCTYFTRHDIHNKLSTSWVPTRRPIHD